MVDYRNPLYPHLLYHPILKPGDLAFYQSMGGSMPLSVNEQAEIVDLQDRVLALEYFTGLKERPAPPPVPEPTPATTAASPEVATLLKQLLAKLGG